MGLPQGQGPMGEAVGGVSVPSGNMSLCSGLPAYTGGNSGGAERWTVSQERRAGQGRKHFSDSCFGQGSAPGAPALTCQIFPPLWHVVPPGNLPRGQITLPHCA